MVNFKKSKMIDVFINMFIIVFTFLIIFTPPIPFVSFNVLHIIGLVSWIIILVNIRKINTFIRTRNFISLVMAIIGLFIYLTVIKVMNNKPILNELSQFYWLLDIIPFAVVLSMYYSRKKGTKIPFLLLLLLIGTIQSLFSLFAYINSDFKKALVDNMIKYGYGDVLNDLSSHRLFGFGSNLTYTMPIIQVVLALLAIYLGMNKNKKYYLFFPLLLFSSIINARTPIIIVGFGLILIILNSRKPIINLTILSITSIISVFILNIMINFFKINHIQNIEWIIDGFYEIYDFMFLGKTDGFFFSYFVDPSTYRLPEGINLLFGIGTRSLGSDGIGVFSDIGFINDIWLGGFVYVIISYSLVGYGMLKIYVYYKHNNENNHAFFMLLMFMSIFIANFKGVILYTNELTTICLVTYVMLFITRLEKRVSI